MSSENKSIYDPPEGTPRDALIQVAKALVSEVPAGGTLVAICEAFIREPLTKRTREWQETIGAAVQKLESRGVDIELLKNNPEFIDLLLQASHAAARTSNENKRQLFCNMICNAALPGAPEESEQLMFVRLLDELTPWHVAVLQLLARPREWFERDGRKAPEFSISSSLHQLIAAAFPTLRGREGFLQRVFDELRAAGLISGDLKAMMTAGGAYEGRCTDWGRQFMKFISDPASL